MHRVDVVAVIPPPGHNTLRRPEAQPVHRPRPKNPRTKPRDVGGDRGGGEVEFFRRGVGRGRIAGVRGNDAAGGSVLPGRVDHGPGVVGFAGCQQLPRGDPQGVPFGLAAADSLAGFEVEIETVLGNGTDDVFADALAGGGSLVTVVVGTRQQPAATVGQVHQTRTTQPIGCLQTHTRLMLPVQLVLGDRTADHRGPIRRASCFDIHSPSPVAQPHDRRGQQSQRHVLNGRVRSQPDARLGLEVEPVLRNGAQDVALAFGERPTGSHGGVEQPKPA